MTSYEILPIRGPWLRPSLAPFLGGSKRERENLLLRTVKNPQFKKSWGSEARETNSKIVFYELLNHTNCYYEKIERSNCNMLVLQLTLNFNPKSLTCS